MTAAIHPRAAGSAARSTAPSAEERAFLDGRDLALGMLVAGHQLRDTDRAAAHRWMRAGAAQNNFSARFLHDLIARPALLPGFSAVLSAAISEDTLSTPTSLADLSMAEVQAGAVGADGTQPGDTEAAPDTSELASVNARLVAMPGGLHDAWAHLNEAEAVCLAATHDVDSELLHATSRLLRQAAELIESSLRSLRHEDATDASAVLASAKAVLSALIQQEATEMVVYGVFTLVDLAKRELDDALGVLLAGQDGAYDTPVIDHPTLACRRSER